MKNNFRSWLIAILAVSLGGLAPALALPIAVPKPPVAPRAPTQPLLTVASGNWVAAGENNRCTASREYGVGPKALLLGLRMKPMNKYISVYVVEHHLNTVYEEPVGVNLGLGQPPHASNIEFAKMSEGRRIGNLGLERDQFDLAVAKGELWIYSKSLNYRFKVNGIKSLLAVMKACEVQVIADNGMTKVDQARMATPPTMLTTFGIFSSDDYPTKAVEKDKQGEVVARLQVDEQGAVSDCKIVESSQFSALDDRACSVVQKRAKFSPALDKQGKPMRSLFFYSIRWII